MNTRRQFLQSIFTTCGALSLTPWAALSKPIEHIFRGEEIFQRVVEKARKEEWSQWSIGEVMGKVALELNGVPYVANTLEVSPDKEICVVNLAGLDCVTFFETTLGFARAIKKHSYSEQGVVDEVMFTRYRGGVIGDFTSRLHYTTDWLADNQQKGVIKLLDQLPGAEPFTQKVGILSQYSDSRMQLKAHPELVSKIREQESAINHLHLKYVPMEKIANIESLLNTGDIVGVCTNTTGVDIVHTGLIYVDKDGIRHFMDASSKKSAMRVQIENGPISKALNWSKSLTGAMFARPLEPI